MAKKGFKLPAPTPIKQTGSTGGSFFQPLNPRNYGASLTSPYANPQSYEAYFPSSTLGGAKTITDLGNTFSDIVTTVSGKGANTDSGSDMTISPTGQLPEPTTAVEGLEKGEDPKLEAKIKEATDKGNLKKAARLQAKQDRKQTRQIEGATRIQARQEEKNKRVKARQQGLTEDFTNVDPNDPNKRIDDKTFFGRMFSSLGNIVRKPTTQQPIQMKEESPNKFLGAAIGAAVGGGGSGSAGGMNINNFVQDGKMVGFKSIADAARQNQAQQAAAASVAAGGTMGTANQNPMTGGAIPEGGGKFQLTPVAMSYDPPLQANEKGGKKSVFNLNTKGMAESAFGTPAMRQASVGAAFQMKPIPEGDEGKGLRSLPDKVVEKMGYDAATKMLSPLDQRGKTVLGIQYSSSPEYFIDSLRRARKDKEFKQSMKPKFTKTVVSKHEVNPKFAPTNTTVQNNKKEIPGVKINK